MRLVNDIEASTKGSIGRPPGLKRTRRLSNKKSDDVSDDDLETELKAASADTTPLPMSPLPTEKSITQSEFELLSDEVKEISKSMRLNLNILHPPPLKEAFDPAELNQMYTVPYPALAPFYNLVPVYPGITLNTMTYRIDDIKLSTSYISVTIDPVTGLVNPIKMSLVIEITIENTVVKPDKAEDTKSGISPTTQTILDFETVTESLAQTQGEQELETVTDAPMEQFTQSLDTVSYSPGKDMMTQGVDTVSPSPMSQLPVGLNTVSDAPISVRVQEMDNTAEYGPSTSTENPENELIKLKEYDFPLSKLLATAKNFVVNLEAERVTTKYDSSENSSAVTDTLELEELNGPMATDAPIITNIENESESGSNRTCNGYKMLCKLGYNSMKNVTILNSGNFDNSFGHEVEDSGGGRFGDSYDNSSESAGNDAESHSIDEELNHGNNSNDDSDGIAYQYSFNIYNPALNYGNFVHDGYNNSGEQSSSGSGGFHSYSRTFYNTIDKGNSYSLNEDGSGYGDGFEGEGDYDGGSEGSDGVGGDGGGEKIYGVIKFISSNSDSKTKAERAGLNSAMETVMYYVRNGIHPGDDVKTSTMDNTGQLPGLQRTRRSLNKKSDDVSDDDLEMELKSATADPTPLDMNPLPTEKIITQSEFNLLSAKVTELSKFVHLILNTSQSPSTNPAELKQMYILPYPALAPFYNLVPVYRGKTLNTMTYRIDDIKLLINNISVTIDPVSGLVNPIKISLDIQITIENTVVKPDIAEDTKSSDVLPTTQMTLDLETVTQSLAQTQGEQELETVTDAPMEKITLNLDNISYSPGKDMMTQDADTVSPSPMSQLPVGLNTVSDAPISVRVQEMDNTAEFDPSTSTEDPENELIELKEYDFSLSKFLATARNFVVNLEAERVTTKYDISENSPTVTDTLELEKLNRPMATDTPIIINIENESESGSNRKCNGYKMLCKLGYNYNQPALY